MIEQIPDNLKTRLEEMDRQMVTIAEALLDPEKWQLTVLAISVVDASQMTEQHDITSWI